MTYNPTRRSLIYLVSLGSAVGLVGCISTFTGESKQQANTTSEEAMETFRNAKEAKRDGHDQFKIEDYSDAENKYRRASILFERANRQFKQASEELGDAGCEEMAGYDRNMATVASTWAQACDEWATAADAMQNGNIKAASDYASNAQEWKQRARNRRESGIQPASC